MKKVLVTRPLRPIGFELLKREVDITVAPDGEEETIFAIVDGFDAIISRGTHIGRKTIEKAKNLKAIATHSAGIDFIDIEAATERGIFVINAPGANSVSVAEYVVCLMLAMNRKLIDADRMLRIEGNYNNRDLVIGNDMKGKTVGIIGMGQIGQKIAKICSAGFSMNVLGYDPYQGEEIYKCSGSVKANSIEEVLEIADFISLNCPLTSEVKGLINKKRIELMKPSAFLINCARGSIVNEPDLIDALKDRKIAGAALDVFNIEPTTKSDPILSCPNLIATPHIAGLTYQSADRMSTIVATDILKSLKGETPVNLVNKSLLTGDAK